ncbi:MAG: hypothetical protein M0Q21_11390 [Ignavibacteriaceae bacterium]|nr:hypothetical protein [Ignavibacteriaceae bacterium]
MKTLLILFVLLLFCYPVAAQDSTGVKEKKEKTVLEADKNENSSFDKKKNDVFIDKDGDGICDFRAKGMSFEKFRKRNHQGLGQGKGKGKN